MTDFARLFEDVQKSVAGLNSKFAQLGASNVATYLTSLNGLRVFVANASGYGHQASSITVLNRLIALGCPATINVAYEAGTENKLRLLLPGFTPGQNLAYQGKTLTFTMVDAKSVPMATAVPLCVTGGMDHISWLPNPAEGLNADVFLQLEPFSWEAKTDGKDNVLNQIWFRGNDQPINLSSVEALGGKLFDRLAFTAADPALTDTQWNEIRAALPKGEQNDLDRAKTVYTYVAVDKKPCQFLPAYGLILPSGSRQPVAMDQTVAAMTLLEAAAEVQNQAGNAAVPIVVVMIGDSPSFWQSLRYVLGPKWDPTAAAEDFGVTNGNLLNAFRADLQGRTVLSENENAARLQQKLNQLQGGQILVMSLKKTPPLVFDLIMATATLPYLFEGQATANLAINLGKPFLKLAAESMDGSFNEVVYQFPMMPEVVASDINEWAYAAIRALRQKVNSPTATTLTAPVYTTFAMTAGGQGQDAANWRQYFTLLRSFYQSGEYDKLTLTLRYLLTLPSFSQVEKVTAELVGSTASTGSGSGRGAGTLVAMGKAPAQTVSGMPGTPAIAGMPAAAGTSPLQTLYNALVANTANGVVNVYPGAIPVGSQPIPTSLAGLFGSGGLQITGTAEFPPPNTKVSVVGPTTSFLGLPLHGEVDFTLDTDGQTLVMDLRLRAPSLEFGGVPWFAIDKPTVEVNVSNAGIRNEGWVRGEVTLGSTVVDVSGTLPVIPIFVLDLDVVKNPPTLGSVFQFIGGVNIASTLPSPLNALAGLALKRLSFAYDQQQSQMRSMTVGVQMTPNWNLVGTFTLEVVDLSFTVIDPAGSASIAWQLTSTFSLGDGELKVGVSYPSTTLTASIPSDSKPIALSDLVDCFLPGGVSLPISGNLTVLDLVLNPGPPVLYALDVGVTGNWPVPSSSFTVFTVEALGFHIDSFQNPTALTISGSITFFAAEPSLAFGLDVSASNSDPGGAWVISGKQDDRPIKVTDILQYYLPSGWFTSGLPDFEVVGFNTEIHTGSTAPGPYYIIGGTVEAFSIPIVDGTLKASASFGNLMSSGAGATGGNGNGSGGSSVPAVLEPATPGAPPALPFGHISVEIEWWGIKLTVGYDYAPGVQSYWIKWAGLTAALTQQNVNGAPHWIAKLTFDSSVTLGSMVETFVSWVTGYRFGLSAPWNILDDISLSGLQLTYDFTAGTVQFAINVGPIELGFCTISSIGLTYNTDAKPGEPKVEVVINGTFPWSTDSPNRLSWDATDPNSTKAPPGGGNEYFYLRLLAMGQHVDVPGISQAQTVQQAVAALANMPATSGDNLPAVTYDAQSAWLVGTDFGVMKFGTKVTDYVVTLQVVFADPDLYALRLALAGEPAKIFGGLDFQILYRKISDTVGVYQAQITLPTAMRTIQAGVFTIQLPTFAIAVYTNGDFQVDVGFPWNNDFSRSFTIQGIVPPGIPLTGSGGFYFGKLSSATTNKVPAVTNGTFDPVIVFGFGIQAGVGKMVEAGPLSASFSITVLAIIEGVIGRWNPYSSQDSGSTTPTQLDGTYYYSLSGTFGIAGRLSGSVDFAIIKASVNVSLVVTAQIVLTSYEPIVFTVAASVDVSASLTINLALFKITLKFHFSLTVRESFEIASWTNDSPPWQVANPAAPGRLTAPMSARLTSRRRALGFVAAAAVTPVWTNLTAPDTALALNGYLTYALTAAGDGASSLAQQQACYVALLALDAPSPDVVAADGVLMKAEPETGPTGDVVGDGDNTSFEALSNLVAEWVIAAFSGQQQSADQIAASIVTDDQLTAILDYLADDSLTQPIPLDALEAMLGEQVQLTIYGPADAGAGVDMTGAIFPMPPDLSFTVSSYGSFPGYQYSFGTYNSISSAGVTALQQYFDQLAIQVEQQGGGGNGGDEAHAAAVGDTTSLSVAGFAFADYFLFIAREMVKSMRAGLRDYKYPVQPSQTAQDVVDWVNQTGQITDLSEQFTVADLFTANPTAPLGSNVAVTITGGTAAIAATDTFTTIASASQYGGAFAAADVVTVNADNDTLLHAGASVAYGGQSTVVDTNDTITAVATRLGATVADLGADSTFVTQTGLLVPFGQVLIPDYTVTAGSGDATTLQAVASAAGVTVAGLASAPANATVVGLFSADDGALLDLPHLPQLPVGVLLAEAQDMGSLSQLAAMLSRFQLQGLRLPTTDITPNDLGMWVTDSGGTLSLPPTAGLYALTGQQLPLPTLGTDPFSMTVSNPDGTDWLLFANGTTSTAFTVTPGDDNATAIGAMQSWIAANRLVTGATDVGAQAALSTGPLSFSFGAYSQWISASLPPLPFGSPVDGATAARIWPLPSGLTGILDHDTHSVAPQFTVETQTYDQATSITTSAPVVNYGWASLIDFTVQRVVGPTSAAGVTTYQLVGVADADSVILENLVAQFQDDSDFAGIWVGYQPDDSLHVNGIQTGSTATVFGIGQANLSTETQPGGGGSLLAAMAEADADAPAGPVALNGNAMFVRLLWEAAITNSGGFYLYYSDNGDGLPDSAFDKNGNATLTLVVMYGAGVDGVADCMNAYVATDPIDTSQSAVVATAIPQTLTVTPDSTTLLSALAFAYYADLGELAETNAAVALTTGSVVTVNCGTYMVSPLGTAPGNTLDAIASYFGADSSAISSLNPGITDWTDLPAYTAIRLPAITVTVGTSPGGSTLASIASYYGADVVSLVVDNQDVAGIFTTALTVAAGPMTTSSTLPAGSQPYELQRPVPSSTATDPESVLLNQFSLLCYQIAANQDFAASNLGAPVGPTGGGGSGEGKLRRARLLAEGDTWTYDIALRYDDDLAGGGGAQGPYDAIGRLLQVEFTWVDLFGNTLITDLSDPQTGDSGPLNLQPELIGYTDPLVALAQWPSVTSGWEVTGAAGAAQLEVELAFDTTRYTGDDGQANATSDLNVYTTLAAQLADPNGIAITVVSSLATDPFVLSSTEFAELTGWVGSIVTYLTDISQGSAGTAPAATFDLSFDLMSVLNPSQLFELTCAVVLARSGGMPQGAFAAVAGISTTSTTVSPLGAASVAGLQAFATTFEAALTSSSTVLKVAAGPNRFEGGAATSATLWAVQVALTSGDAIGYSIDDSGQPVIFAPAPLSTQLVSESAVGIYPYVSGTGIDYDNPSPQNFTNIDLDQWVRTIFAAVDSILAPEYISSLVILDELTSGTNVETLQANKAALAAMYAQQMLPVFTTQTGTANATVAALFEQTMLQQLSNAYSTQAALQFAADVVASITEDPAPAEPPNLYGDVVQNDTPTPGVAFTSAKLPLTTASGVPLACLVTTPNQTAGFEESAAITVDLSYVPSEIEHQIGLVPGIVSPPGTTPYYASTWLQFVVPLPSSSTAELGSFEVPMVLRAYPTSPGLVTQTGVPTDPTASDVVDLSEWTYAVTYSLPIHYPQDTVYGTIVFNVQAPAELEAASFADCFPALAEFVTVFPDISVDLTGALASITPSSGSQTIDTAAAAIGAVNAMLGNIVGTGGGGGDGGSGEAARFAVRDRRRPFVSGSGTTWSFSIQEDAGVMGSEPEALVVTVLPTSGPVPQVSIAGYTAQPYTGGSLPPPPGASQYYYVGSTGDVLTFADAQTIGPRSVVYAGLPVLDQQDALTTLWVTRNENLVSGMTTNPEFVFRTPDVAYSSPLQPTITSSNPIDLALIGSTNGKPVTRSLDAHLTALFDALATGSDLPDVQVQMTITYSYTVNPQTGVPALPVSVPVLFQPPTQVEWVDQGDGQPTVAEMITQLSAAVTTWFSATSPSLTGGVLAFDLTITSTLTAQTMPLLRLSNLSVALPYIVPAP